ncbi:phosphatidylserine decarboxylase [Actinocorallia lasiicapitis]
MPGRSEPDGEGRTFARGAAPWLIPGLVGSASAAFLARRSRFRVPVGIAAAGLAGGMAWFFRDPAREGEGLLLSGADGVVQSIQEWPDGRTRVAVFMSPLDVHVNRAPIAGKIISVDHIAGGHVPAFNKDSDRNERVVWKFATEIGELECVQIAGTVARRIVPYLEEGATVTQGERIGLIRFGSRFDVYLPQGIRPAVTVGQKTRAGETHLVRS